MGLGEGPRKRIADRRNRATRLGSAHLKAHDLSKKRAAHNVEPVFVVVFGHCLFNGTVESAREKQAARCIYSAVDNVEHLSRRSIEGDGVISRRRIAREAAQKRTVHGVAQVGDHRSCRSADAKIILILSS